MESATPIPVPPSDGAETSCEYLEILIKVLNPSKYSR